MLDLKILAAVFAALTAVAVTTGGGSVNKASLDTPQSDLDSKFSIGEYIDNLKKVFSEEKKPVNNIEANFTVEDLYKKSIKVENGEIQLKNFSKLQLKKQNLSSKQTIRPKNFTGSIMPGKPSQISGNSALVQTDSMNITGISKIDHSTDRKFVEFKNVEKLDLSYSNVTGSIETNSTDTVISDIQKIDLKSFSGDIKILVDKKKLMISGEFYSFKSGELELGE